MNESKKVLIDGEALRKWMQGRPETRYELGEMIGKGGSYFYDVIRRGTMSIHVYRLFLKVFNLPEGSFLLPAEPEPACEPEPPAVAQTESTDGWRVSLQVMPKKGKVRFAVLVNGEEMVHAHSWIKKQGDYLSIMQAISYAAHMCYKLTEEKVLENIGEDGKNNG